MVIKKVTIVNKLGLHARAAAKLVALASQFSCDITIKCNDEEPINAKSIMAVMMLAAGRGTELEITIEGNEETIAMSKVKQLIEDRFGESE
ncbi:MAG: HPr family phosphocarrier protein [Gammaproteobacteria bacterium]|nr:HPr family phosphocarrier protein [Gammaproteobacteria bacterium]MCP4474681.1 HPr family phosphocarrier protein [Gammaproteobacteria bacterium]